MIITFVVSLQQTVKEVIWSYIICFSASSSHPVFFPSNICVFLLLGISCVSVRDVLVTNHKSCLKGNRYEHSVCLRGKEKACWKQQNLFDTYNGISDNDLKEILEYANKSEASLLIIKSNLKKIFSVEPVRWKAWYRLDAFIKVSDVEKVIDVSCKLAVRTTYAKWTPKFVRSISFFLRLSHTLIHTHFCVVHFQFDLFYGFLTGLSWKIRLIEPCCEISITQGCSRFSECGPCSIHICMMHRVQKNINQGNTWFIHRCA